MRLSTILVTAASLARTFGQDPVFKPCVETTASGDSFTGFEYANACTTWAWLSSDESTEVSIQADCSLRQNWPNDVAVSYVCIQIAQDPTAAGAVQNKCFWAPDSSTNNTACQLPASHCPGVVNAWGWRR
ncbi:uncharacterized protein LY79DRAFT_573871 [Colletotrichum navitas]|uniref:Uncharacterized protein n=1 Tax=Colletotrichum navitas TaxID=681940 RepID=A0AAD8UUN3_9PEZI|nr:uncharacterized protein LY79DRAFT_573871 [Colletotrichum navitas]KAK1563963.1 hypothetical protein LY79DRAFT_573871 [Colletotrichum navitas]